MQGYRGIARRKCSTQGGKGIWFSYGLLWGQCIYTGFGQVIGVLRKVDAVLRMHGEGSGCENG